MAWREYLHNDRQEQDQLDILRALIEDATKDTALWLEADPSAEKRAHVLAIQERLADLARIVERWMERRKEVRDGWVWYEIVDELKSRVEKAREARGGKILGKGLARLAEHLPEGLPGTKPPKRPHVTVPPPVKPVNTSGSIGLNPAPSPLSAGGGLKSVDFYPREFSLEVRDRIGKEKIRACRELLPRSVYDFNQQDLAVRCIMRIFLAFAKEACALRKEHGWTIDRVQDEAEEFLRRLTIRVIFEKFPGLDRHWISNWNGSINDDVERRFRETAEWKEYENLLLESPLDATAQDSPAQNSDKAVQSVESESTNSAAGNTREAMLRAILKKKGFTVHGWARKANVDFHTADDYLKGKTKPYANTLKDLADALGIEVTELPE